MTSGKPKSVAPASSATHSTASRTAETSASKTPRSRSQGSDQEWIKGHAGSGQLRPFANERREPEAASFRRRNRAHERSSYHQCSRR
jgi:hypothetical protein